MRGFFAAVMGFIGAVLGLFLGGFIGCTIAMKAESIPLAFVAMGLAVVGACAGGYLGAKLVLMDDSTGSLNRDLVDRETHRNESGISLNRDLVNREKHKDDQP